MAELKERFAAAEGEFVVEGSRNLCRYPKIYLMDRFSTQIRHLWPLHGGQARGDDLPPRAQW